MENFRKILLIVFVGFLAGNLIPDARSQNLVDSNIIVFTRPKGTAKEGLGGGAAKGNAGKYKISSQLAQRRRKRAGKPGKAKTEVDVAANQKLGVTLWKLRPEKTGDEGARLLTMGGAKDGSKLVAERVALDTEFKVGEKVRFSIESPQTGFLYIIDRELHTDGTLGEPFLIFPTQKIRGGDNSVSSGRVIEIPSQSDAQTYFDFTVQEANYVGELITVVFSENRIQDFQIGREPLKLTAKWIENLENQWERNATTFELQTGTRGLAYTDDEKAAGEGTRQLTQSSAAPQTFISIEKQRNDKAFVVSFPIKVVK